MLEQVWDAHGEWVTKEEPHLGPGIKDRFQMASKITADEVSRLDRVRLSVCLRVRSPPLHCQYLVINLCSYLFVTPLRE